MGTWERLALDLFSELQLNNFVILPFIFPPPPSLPPSHLIHTLSVRGCIGSGHFGTVHKGVWKVPGGTIDVAVKTLKVDASEGDKVVFLREAAIMGQFLHPNVVKLYGVVTVGEPVSIYICVCVRSEGDE